jgi:hypothetical protein
MHPIPRGFFNPTRGHGVRSSPLGGRASDRPELSWQLSRCRIDGILADLAVGDGRIATGANVGTLYRDSCLFLMLTMPAFGAALISATFNTSLVDWVHPCAQPNSLAAQPSGLGGGEGSRVCMAFRDAHPATLHGS